MSAEPRRSVRATKGQHKSLDALDAPAEPKRRQTKKGGRKAQADLKEDEQKEEEIIRCICGNSQDDGTAYVACEKCNSWQHNVCMGVSIFDEDIPEIYHCEQCKPQDHTETLEALARGEKPWEPRQKAHREQEAEKKGKKRGGRRKRVSDQKPATASRKEETPTEPEPSAEEPEPKAATGKRKAKDQDHEVKGPAHKLRRLAAPEPELEPKVEPEPEPEPESRSQPHTPEPASEKPAEKQVEESSDPLEPEESAEEVPEQSTEQASENPPEPSVVQSVEQPVEKIEDELMPDVDESTEPAPETPTEVTHSNYEPPANLATSIADLPNNRHGPVNLLLKNFNHALESAVKSGNLVLKPDEKIKSKAERMALELERAVHDLGASHKAYTSQVKTLAHNIKNNPELCSGLLRQTLSPTTLAHMKSEDLASKEQQKERQEIRAKVEKQSIIVPTDGPRLRRTHKGEELVENEAFLVNEEPPSIIRRPSLRESTGPAPGLQSPQDGSQQSPKTSNFDLNKVFAAVSPTATHSRRTSHANNQGPGIDPEVDRLLQDDTDSPPYSPREDDADIVWRGMFTMTSIGEFPCVAKHAAGANLKQAIGLDWGRLFPSRIAVAGRIETDKAMPYLCGLRYNNRADIVVTTITPASPSYEHQFRAVIDYFTERKRYGVVGDKGVGNVRDTYIVPVLPQDDGYPEFMLNLHDNFFPREKVTEPTLLLVFVYQDALKPAMSPSQVLYPSYQNTPAFSPTSPFQAPGPFPPPNHHQRQGHPTPQSPVSHPASHGAQGSPPTPNGNSNVQNSSPAPTQPASQETAEAAGYHMALEILGPEFANAPTLRFVLANAMHMSRKEWELIRRIYEKDEKARRDLTYLAALIETEANAATAAQQKPAASTLPPTA